MSSYIFPGCLPSAQMTQELIDAEHNTLFQELVTCILEPKKRRKKKIITLLKCYTWLLKRQTKNGRIKQSTGTWKEKKWGQESKPWAWAVG